MLVHHIAQSGKSSLTRKKTKNICFGKGKTPTHCVHLNGSVIPWEENCVYLGVTLKSGATFGCCMKEILRKFYRSLNSIIRVEGRSDDMVMLRLLEAIKLSMSTTEMTEDNYALPIMPSIASSLVTHTGRE